MGKALLDKPLPKQTVRKIEMLDNNKSSLILTKKLVSQNRAKYIDVTDAPSYTRSSKRRKTKN